MPSRRVGVLFLVGIGHATVDRRHHLGRRAPGDLRRDRRGVDRRRCGRTRRRRRSAACASARPRGPTARRSARTAAPQVVDRRVVDGDHAGARAGLDRHVAHGHPAFHRQRADGAAAELDRVAGAAGGADPADHREREVLGRHAGGRAGRRRGSAATSPSSSAGTAWPARARPRRCRCRTRAPRTRRACWCASRRRRRSCPGSVAPCSGPITWTMPCRASRNGK